MGLRVVYFGFRLYNMGLTFWFVGLELYGFWGVVQGVLGSCGDFGMNSDPAGLVFKRLLSKRPKASSRNPKTQKPKPQ